MLRLGLAALLAALDSASSASSALQVGVAASQHRSLHVARDDDDTDNVYDDDGAADVDEDDSDGLGAGDADSDEPEAAPEAAPQKPSHIARPSPRRASAKGAHRTTLLAPRSATRPAAHRAELQRHLAAQPPALKASTDPTMVGSSPSLVGLSTPFGNDPSRYGMYDFSHTAESGSVSLLTADQARHEDIEAVATHEQSTEDSGEVLQKDGEGDDEADDDGAANSNGNDAGMLEHVMTDRDSGSEFEDGRHDEEQQWG